MRDISSLRGLVETPNSRLRGVDPRIKLAIAILWVGILASIPIHKPTLYGPQALAFLTILVLGAVPPRGLLVRLTPLLPFGIPILAIPFLHPGAPLDLAAFLPNATQEGIFKATSVLLRMLSIGSIMAALSATTPFDELLHALRFFRVPSGVTTSLSLMFRYLYLLLEEGQRLVRAYSARGGQWRPRALARQSVGNLAGALFLRAYARAERTHSAMLARGFDGHQAVRPFPPIRAAQPISASLFALVLIVLRTVGAANG